MGVFNLLEFGRGLGTVVGDFTWGCQSKRVTVMAMVDSFVGTTGGGPRIGGGMEWARGG